MRPGELLPAAGDAPSAAIKQARILSITNRGRFTAFIGSHFPLAQASSLLEFSRDGLEGARLRLPAGQTLMLKPGEQVDVEIVWT